MFFNLTDKSKNIDKLCLTNQEFNIALVLVPHYVLSSFLESVSSSKPLLSGAQEAMY